MKLGVLACMLSLSLTSAIAHSALPSSTPVTSLLGRYHGSGRPPSPDWFTGAAFKPGVTLVSHPEATYCNVENPPGYEQCQYRGFHVQDGQIQEYWWGDHVGGEDRNRGQSFCQSRGFCSLSLDLNTARTKPNWNKVLTYDSTFVQYVWGDPTEQTSPVWDEALKKQVCNEKRVFIPLWSHQDFWPKGMFKLACTIPRAFGDASPVTLGDIDRAMGIELIEFFLLSGTPQ